MKFKISILAILLGLISLTTLSLNAFDKSKLPKLLGASNAGTEFYMTFIPCWETSGASNLIRIYVTSNVQTEVTLSIEGKSYEVKKMTIPNDIIEFAIEPDLAQVYRKVHWEYPKNDSIWVNSAIRITSDAPIICYGLTRYLYTSDGFLALPVHALGKSYIVSSYADPSAAGQFLPSYTSITAPYDDTKVHFKMGGSEFSKTASGQLPDETTSWNMNKGDVLLIGSVGTHAELSGSTIEATKPVSVISGNFCAYVPTNCGCCDFLIEQELPTNSWGTEYHVTKIAGRLKNSIVKVFAKEPKTNIYRDFELIGFIQTAGGVAGKGYLEFRADEGNPRPVNISGNKPINVTQFNTGQQDDGMPSDPFQMVLEPIEQYQDAITFCTPGIKGGYGFAMNYINICYQPTEFGTIPDDFEFGSFVNDSLIWQKLNRLSPNPGEPFAKELDGKQFYSKTLMLPGDGVYKLKAEQAFAAYSYGFSNYDSYGYPTAGYFIENIDDKMPPTISHSQSNDGSVKGNVNTANSQENSTLSLAMLYQPESYNYEFKANSFVPGSDFATDWELNVKDPTKDAKALMVFADKSGNDTVLVFEYKGISGIEDMANSEEISLYPQPVSTEINILFDNKFDSPISINIIDLNGKLIKVLIENEIQTIGKQNLQFNLNELSSGTYIIQILTSKGILSKKFIKN